MYDDAVMMAIEDLNLSNNISDEEFSCLEVDQFSSTISELAWTVSPSSYSSIPYIATVLFIFFVISFCWNGFIIVTYLFNYKLLKRSIAVFLFIGAVSDLLASVNTMLLRFVTIVTRTYSHFGNNNISLCQFCDLEGFFLIFLSSFALHIRAAFAFDRFILIYCVFSWNTWKGKGHCSWLALRITLTVVLIILWSFFVAILPIATGFGQYKFNTQIGACLPRLEGLSVAGVQNVYYSTFLVLVALIPLLISNVSNIFLLFVVLFLRRKHHRRSNHCNVRTYNRAILKLVIIFVACALSWSPVIVTVFVVNDIPTTVVPSGLFLFVWIIFLTNHFTFSITEPLLNGDIVSMIHKAAKHIPYSTRKFNVDAIKTDFKVRFCTTTKNDITMQSNSIV